MLKEIAKPEGVERNDMPPYTAKNGYTFEQFVCEDGDVVERATKGKAEKWFILIDEDDV